MKVLLVSPGFHGYASSIGRTLSSLGHDARIHLYDRLPGPVGRALWTAPHGQLATRARGWITSRAIGALNDSEADVVLTIKGDQLEPDWWEAVRDSRVRRVTWFYDELVRMRYQRETLHMVGPIATYSPLDAAELTRDGVDAQHVALGFDALSTIEERPSQGVTFIGARYQNRETILRQLALRDVPVTAYGRQWSRRWSDRARTGFLPDPGVATAPELRRESAYGVMRASDAALNLHGEQDGFTMRTFEAAGVGGVEMCDRADVSAHYDVGTEVLVFHHLDELVALCERAAKDLRWAAAIRSAARRRTLAHHTLAHRLQTLEALWA